MTPLHSNSKTLNSQKQSGGCRGLRWGRGMRSCCSMGRVSGLMSEFWRSAGQCEPASGVLDSQRACSGNTVLYTYKLPAR